MKKWNLLALVCILSALFCLAGSGAAYSGGTMKDLGTLGGNQSEALGINNKGQIVGWSYMDSGFQHAFIYSGGKMTDLGTLPGGLYSYATGINDKGQIVGYSDTASGEEHAFLYSYPAGTMKDLGTLDGDRSRATGINKSGQIVGWVRQASGQEHAFLYSGGTMTDLGTLGGNNSYATAINNNGQIVGYSNTSSGQEHAFLYTSAGTWKDLGTLPGTGRGPTAKPMVSMTKVKSLAKQVHPLGKLVPFYTPGTR